MKKYLYIIAIILTLSILISIGLMIKNISKLKYENAILSESNTKLHLILNETIEMNHKIQKLNEEAKDKISLIKLDNTLETSIDINDQISEKFNAN